MKNRFKKATIERLENMRADDPELLTVADIGHLPQIVQKYLHFTGFMGREKILNFRSEFKGGIRFHPDEPFMRLESVQYNFMDNPARFFYILARKKGIPAIGLHLYRFARATFQVKMLGMFTVVNAKGPKMDQSETVTVLNDMFFMAPGALIDRRITWEELDELSVRAVFTNDDIRISAVINFDSEGRLTNFISHDRFDTDGKKYRNDPWETPATAYGEYHRFTLPSKARLIYKRSEGDFCYGEFELKSIAYNCRRYS